MSVLINIGVLLVLAIMWTYGTMTIALTSVGLLLLGVLVNLVVLGRRDEADYQKQRELQKRWRS